MKFEIGKFYRHTNGLNRIVVLGWIGTITCGVTMIAERPDGTFKAVGDHEGATVGWTEITKEEWFKEE